MTAGFKPVTLKGETFSASYAVNSSRIVSHNILGMLKGARRPQETVFYTAHWDHLGVGAPDAKGDRIYNGAIDNADGVASILELARVFARAPRTERSVVFMSVTAEEKGLLGSEYYVTHPIYPLATTAAVVQHRCAGRRRAGARLLHLRRQQEHPAGRPDSRGPARTAAISRPTPCRRPGTSSAPITSPSPRAACRRCRSSRARTSTWAARPRGRRPRTSTSSCATTSRPTSGRRRWTGAARPSTSA